MYHWQDVGQVLVGTDGAAGGVVLKDGTEIHSKVVLSNATPYVTFKKLMPQVMEKKTAICMECSNLLYLFILTSCVLCRVPSLQSSLKLWIR